MLKVIMIIAFLIVTAMALTFACACVVGSRYEKKEDAAQSQSKKRPYFNE